MRTQSGLLLCVMSLAAGAGFAIWQHQPIAATSQEPGFGETRPHHGASGTGGNAPFLIPAGADATTLTALLEDELAKAGPDALRMEAVFMRWFERAPDLQAEYQALCGKYPAHRQALMRAFHTAWAWHDCDAAFAKVKVRPLEAWPAVWAVACALEHPVALSPLSFPRTIDFSPAQRLARRNPAWGPDLLEAAAHLNIDDDLFTQAALRGWAESDPAGLMKYWCGKGRPFGTRVIQSALLWLRRDPGALAKIPDDARQELEQNASFRCLVGKPPVKQWNDIAGYADEDFCLILDRLDPCMLPADFLRTVINASPPEPERRPDFFLWSARTSLPSWNFADPAWTLDPVMTLEAGPYRDAYIRMVLVRWKSTDYPAAASYAREHGLPPLSPPEPSGPPAPLPLSSIGEMLSSPPSPSTAASASDREFRTLSTSLAQAMHRNPENTLRWLEQTMGQLPPEGKERLLPCTGDLMKDADLPTVTAWASHLPGGPLKDSVIGGMMENLARYDPMTALSWAASTSKTEEYASRLVNDLTNTIGQAGAPILIRNSALPPAFKELMLSKLSKP